MIIKSHVVERIRFSFDRRNPCTSVETLEYMMIGSLCLSALLVMLVPFTTALCGLILAIKSIMCDDYMVVKIIIGFLFMTVCIGMLICGVTCCVLMANAGIAIPIVTAFFTYDSLCVHEVITSLKAGTSIDVNHILYSKVSIIMTFLIGLFFDAFFVLPYGVNLITAPLFIIQCMGYFVLCFVVTDK